MDLSYEEFRSRLDRSSSKRRELLTRDGRHFFVLMSQQFNQDDLEKLCDTATSIRRLDRVVEGRDYLRGLLRGVRIMNLFAQPSTRTAESFMAAADKLGASSRLVSDLQTSSFAKGESIDDSVRTLSSFFDAIVTRHPDDDFGIRASWALSRSGRVIPVISAGSGKSQHVTQSLLDIYTLRYSFADRGGVHGKSVVIIGDIARNRAGRSLAYLLTKFDAPTLHFVSPVEFQPEDGLLEYIRGHGIEVHVHHALQPLLEKHGRELDAIYVTRSQKEWDTGGLPSAHAEIGSSDEFVLKTEYREFLRPDCVIMHPLPRVNELPDAWEEHPGFVVWRQVRNGMWIRAAVFASVFGADAEIRHRASRLGLL
jgi:aspartate carbamoyltransferase catalytic subunit